MLQGALGLLLAVGFVTTFAHAADDQATTINDGWVYRWGDSGSTWLALESAATGTPPGRTVQNVLWIKRTIPSGTWLDPALVFAYPIQIMEVYIDGKVVTKTGDVDRGLADANSVRDQGNTINMVPISREDFGREIAVRFYSHRPFVGFYADVSIGSRASLTRSAFLAGLPTLSLCAIFAFIGILGIFFFAASPKQHSFLWFGMFSLWSGIYLATRTACKQLIYDDPVFWLNLEFHGLRMIMATMTVFLWAAFGPCRFRMNTICALATSGWAIAALALQVFTPFKLIDSLLPTQILCLPILLTYIIYYPILAYRGSVEARFVAGGAAAYMLFAGIDVLANLGILPIQFEVTAIGTLCVIVALGGMLGYRFMLTVRRVQRLKRRLEVILDRTREMATLRTEAEVVAVANRAISGDTAGELMSRIDLVTLAQHGQETKSLCLLGHPGAGQDLAVNKSVLDATTTVEIGANTIIPLQSGRAALMVTSAMSPNVDQDEALNFVGAIGSSLIITIQNIEYLREAVMKERVDAELRAQQEENRIIRDLSERMRRILHSIEHGIVTVDEGLLVDDGFSAHMTKIFGVPPDQIVGRNLMEFCFRSSQFSKDEIHKFSQCLLASIGADSISWDVNRPNLPNEGVFVVAGETKILGLEWTPLVDLEDRVSKVMVVITDLTEERQMQVRLRQYNEENERLLSIVQQTMDGGGERLVAFLKDAEVVLNKLSAVLSTPEFDIASAFRTLHTIKGTARSLALRTISDHAHLAEEIMQTARDGAPWSVSALKETVEALSAENRRYLKLADAVMERSGQGGSGLTPSLLRFVGEHGRVMKKNLELGHCRLGSIACADDVIDWKAAEFGKVSMMLVHALNNCVDHGYVLPVERGRTLDAAAFKVSSSIKGDVAVISIEDHGGGVAMAKLRDLATRRGALEIFERDPTEILFLDGASTAERVSATSGRGVGLSAIRQMAREMGGDAKLELPAEGGSRLVVTILARNVVASRVTVGELKRA